MSGFASPELMYAAAELFKVTVSFGSTTSLISLPCFMSHASIPAEIRAARGLPDDLVRISAGIEAKDDLIADLAQAFAKGEGDWEKIETDLLNGQKLQGTGTAKDVMTCIKKLGCEKDFPLFCAIHKIAFEGAKPESVVDLYK